MAKGDSFGTFLNNNIGWTLNFVFAHILFWVVGFDKFDKYGYTDSLSGTDGTGGYASGPSGNGVFVISITLMILGTCTWFATLVRFERTVSSAAPLLTVPCFLSTSSTSPSVSRNNRRPSRTDGNRGPRPFAATFPGRRQPVHHIITLHYGGPSMGWRSQLYRKLANTGDPKLDQLDLVGSMEEIKGTSAGSRCGAV
jgi:hypothetical protein